MAQPTTREQFKENCLRNLGHPVVEVNLDDDQIEDAIDSALSYFQDFHYDSMNRWYFKHQITDTDKSNRYIPITENIAGITRVFNVNASNASMSMFDLRYQMRLHELYDFTSTSYVNFVMTQQHIRMIDMLFTGEVGVRWSRHTDRLYIDWDWENDVAVGEWIVIEGFIVINPDTFNKVWSDRLLKKLATAYMKKTWGMNMKKYGNMQLLGGITMNGQQYYDEATAEIAEIEEKIRSVYEEPPQFIVG